MKEGRYEYQEVIGKGGMATVYRGLQVSLDRPVAIKVLSKQLSSDPSIRERFHRESLIIARLNHPNIIHVIDKGTTSKGRPVFIMEYVEGKTLTDVIRANTLPFNKKIDLIIQICKGLSYAHKAGIIHRDIKPANVLVDTDDNARLLDFGIATFFEDESAKDSEAHLILGTDGYMAPEQGVSAKYTSAASDIYSLGVMMYEIFTGRLPQGAIRPPSAYEPKLEGTLDRLVMQCLHESPEKRPHSVEDIKNRLLLTMRGKHLGTAQMARANQGMQEIKQKFGLLDVVKESRYGSVYLFEEKQAHNLLIIKKKIGKFAGYKESKILAQLKHPNIINILGTSRKDDVFIMVMEYLSGGSLQDRLVSTFALDEFVIIARQVCSGLSFAHKNRIVHGNLRPSNVLFTDNFQAKLTDFCLDEHYQADAGSENWYRPRREEVSELTDIYSLGVIFFQMLVGSLPDYKDGKLIRRKQYLELPEDAQTLLARMLELDTNQRIPSVDAVLSEINALVDDKATAISRIDDDDIFAGREVKHLSDREQSHAGVLFLILLLVLSLALNVYFLNGGTLHELKIALGMVD